MAELRVWTDLDRNSLTVWERAGEPLRAEPERFTIFARVSSAPADAYLSIDLPQGFFLPDEDRGERDARTDIDVGWQIEVAPEREPIRGTMTIRLISFKAVVASTQIQVSTFIEGSGSFDPERDAFPFPARPHLFGTPRPSREVFDATFRGGFRTPLRWLLYRGLYRRLFAAGISSGMARAALKLAANRYEGAPPSRRRVLDRDTRELVQLMHGRQLGDGLLGTWRNWMARASPAAVFATSRADMQSGRPQRLAIDIGLPKVAAWAVLGALTRPRATVVPFQYRIAPNGAVVTHVYDPEHPDDSVNNVLHIDLASDRYEYREWSSDGPDGQTVLAVAPLEPFSSPQSALQAGLAQMIGLV